jgi:hypothetical protein
MGHSEKAGPKRGMSAIRLVADIRASGGDGHARQSAYRPKGSDGLGLFDDQRDCEAVIAFDAYRLDGRHAHSRLRGGQRIEVADALDMRVATIFVDQRAFAYHVVNDDQAAPARELQRPAEILGSALLIGVDENEIERAACLGGEAARSRARARCAPLPARRGLHVRDWIAPLRQKLN